MACVKSFSRTKGVRFIFEMFLQVFPGPSQKFAVLFALQFVLEIWNKGVRFIFEIFLQVCSEPSQKYAILFALQFVLEISLTPLPGFSGSPLE